jgi:hypothetical protein
MSCGCTFRRKRLWVFLSFGSQDVADPGAAGTDGDHGGRVE